MERLSSAFFKLLDELTIARSRKHIREYYPVSYKELGGFPHRSKPIPIYIDIDLHGKFMSYDELNDEISNYQLSLFNPSKYVLPEYLSQYDMGEVRNFTQKDREHYLNKKPTEDKRGRPNRKVLVFTAFADTATYLYNALEDWVKNEIGINIALVTGGTGGNKTTFDRSDFVHILINLSPRGVDSNVRIARCGQKMF